MSSYIDNTKAIKEAYKKYDEISPLLSDKEKKIMRKKLRKYIKLSYEYYPFSCSIFNNK